MAQTRSKSMLMDVRHTRLPGGLRVVTSRIPHVQSVTLGIWVGVGSRFEPAPLSGISHFTEHLLFKGTRRRSPRDISVAIEGRGGYLNAFTSEEHTCYYARVGFDHLNEALDVLSDMYLNSRFAAAEIVKERQVITEEIMMYRDQPRHAVQEMLTELLWEDHPLGRPVIGSTETLQRMNHRAFRDFVGRRYVAANTVVALAGQVDHDACVQAVQGLMKKLPAGRAAGGAKRVTPGVRQKRAAFEAREIEQTHLALGIRLFGYLDERRHPMRILSAVLGENMSSRLFQIVREKHGLAYSVHSSLHLFRDSGALVVSAGLDRKRKAQALKLIVGELERLKKKAVGAAELRRAKDYAIGQMRLGLESTTHQMMWIGDNFISRGRFMPPEQTIRKLAAVTAEDVRKLAGATLRRSHASLAIISPDLSREDQSAMRTALDKL